MMLRFWIWLFSRFDDRRRYKEKFDAPKDARCWMIARRDAAKAITRESEDDPFSSLRKSARAMKFFRNAQAGAAATGRVCTASAGVQAVDLRPAHADGFAGAQAVAVDQAEKHAVAERIPPALAGRLDHTAGFGRPEIAAIRYFRLFARRARGSA